ncbi:ATP-dependent DNA helicase RecG [Nitrincola sp. A-D6]|uniref:ATP-dependent DNA helicase RecG n=1 Tax=Nitrincola sp. A-D6 TaxID=1545442 RepID=UPI00051FB2B1|nr:ATP-dependent DNA helicase RecG [Nitrincola sp. A-D6]KGK42789.1 ATP-dependent DNA helicase RecG [Nitrincola sp. A-D6]
MSGISIRELKGVGTALELKLAKLGILTLQDLLFHLPLRYQDRTHIRPMGALQPGAEGVVEGELRLVDVVTGRRRSLLCRLQDATGQITLRFFHFSAGQKNALKPGVRIRAFGEVRPGSAGLEMIHPEYQLLASGQPPPPPEQALTPVYPLTEGLTQNRLRSLVHQALQQLSQTDLPDFLPIELRQSRALPELNQALRYLHHPPPEADQQALLAGRHPAQRRLALEELLAQHLSLIRVRQRIQHQGGWPLPPAMELEQAFLQRLPFALTAAQQRVIAEIAQDLSTDIPMLRLVQGDVGSGKTLVAALAVVQAIAAGYQAALMAPTEVLAEQHYIAFQQWFEPLGIQVAWLAGKVKGKQRNQQLESIALGTAALVVGTHALFQDEVKFARLALVVIDEQHRFGVHQRLSLREKGRDGVRVPHQLIMTATPIPRTLTMSAYADLDCSVIDELPPGRTPVNTRVISDTRRDEVVARVREACAQGRQAYWVCTLIEESEVLECQAAEVTAEQLALQLPELRIGLVHGRMKAGEKAAVMAAFKAAELDLLVATTVIEVGVDVPNASLMIIENPERLGLAQLHQLRGRVGRGSIESFCLLMYHAPLSRQGRERLQVMRETTDGFRIAEKDLELRGPGEVLGTRQTGMMQFRIADLERDADLLPQIKSLAEKLKGQPNVVDALILRWMGSSETYAQV